MTRIAALTVQDVLLVLNLLYANGHSDVAQKLSADLAAPQTSSGGDDASTVEQLRARVAELEEGLDRERRNARVRQRRRGKTHAGQEPLFDPLRAVGNQGERDRFEARNDVPDPDPLRSKSEDQDQTRAQRARTTPVHHNADHPPEWAIEMWRALRPELAEAIFRRCWKRFVERKSSHRSQKDAARHLRIWLRNEDARPLVRDADIVTDDEPEPVSESRPITKARVAAPVTMRAHALERALALMALDERATGPPTAAPGGA